MKKINIWLVVIVISLFLIGNAKGAYKAAEKEAEAKTAPAKIAAQKKCQEIIDAAYRDFNNKVQEKVTGYESLKPFLPDVYLYIKEIGKEILVIQHTQMSEEIAFDILNNKIIREIVYNAGFELLIFSSRNKNDLRIKGSWSWIVCNPDTNSQPLLSHEERKPLTQIQYGQIKQEIKTREAYASSLEEGYLERGLDVHVLAVGPENTTLRFIYILMNKAKAYEILKIPGFREKAQRLGFNKIRFVSTLGSPFNYNGYDYMYNVHTKILDMDDGFNWNRREKSVIEVDSQGNMVNTGIYIK